MAPFEFKSNTHFVGSSDGTTLQVYQLTEPATTNFSPSSSVQNDLLKKVANIRPDLEPLSSSSSSYDGLLFPDGRGRVEGREAMALLARHLAQLRLTVSPGGYCFQDVSEVGMYVDFGVRYLRLNDLFCWSDHGVGVVVEPSTTIATTVWARSEMKHYGPLFSSSTKSTDSKYEALWEEMEKLKREKEEQVAKTTELEATVKELQEKFLSPRDKLLLSDPDVDDDELLDFFYKGMNVAPRKSARPATTTQ